MSEPKIVICCGQILVGADCWRHVWEMHCPNKRIIARADAFEAKRR